MVASASRFAFLLTLETGAIKLVAQSSNGRDAAKVEQVINPNMNATEARIVSRIIDRAILRGYTVSVHDSIEGDGAWTVKRSQDRAAILAALATTGGDLLRIRDASGAAVGTIMLVYNGDDSVVADHSSNATIDALVQS